MARWSQRSAQAAKARKPAKSNDRRRIVPRRDISDEHYTQTCLHEAAHIVAAHAIGRRPTYARSIPVYLPADGPTNGSGEPVISYGFNNSEPRLADEITAAARAGVPLTQEQREWLLGEAVICMAPLGFDMDGDEGDRRQIGTCARMLRARHGRRNRCLRGGRRCCGQDDHDRGG